MSLKNRIVVGALGLFLFQIAQAENIMDKSSAEMENKQKVVETHVLVPELTDAQRYVLIQEESQKENWSRVLELLVPLAQKGDRQSQVNLGILYSAGHGVERDFKKAYWWFSEAAKRGSVKALNNMAVLYLEGRGVEKQVQHSAKLFEISAKSGSVDAMLMLGYLYKNELKKPKLSFKWFKLASENGNEKATFNLAMLYEQGIGTQKDIKKAIELYRIMAEKGDFKEQAQQKLEKLLN